MMWLFAILIVLALGGVALLAAGKGEPMAPAYDDRPDTGLPDTGLPDTGLPETRPLRSDDLRRARFSLALRGYRMSEVDALLDRLAIQLDDSSEAAGPREGRGGEPTS